MKVLVDGLLTVFLRRIYLKNIYFNGGGGEIRTHGRVAPTTIFKTVAFNRSATPPGSDNYNRNKINYSLGLLHMVTLQTTGQNAH